jgi:hypothetical protein
MRDSLGEVPGAPEYLDDPLIHVNTQDLMKRLADATRLKLEGEVKDPTQVPEYRRPKPPMPELDAVTGEEVITLRPEFFDKTLSYDDLFRSYCERRKETDHERRQHHPSMVRARKGEQNESLQTLQGPETKEVPLAPRPARDMEPVRTRSAERTVPETVVQRSSMILDGSFADTDSDF